MTESKFVGRPVARLEDGPLVTGRGRFAADVNFPGQVHMRVVRSPLAHGRIQKIEVDAARAAPGVFAVWTSVDIPELPPIDLRDGTVERLSPFRQPVLAQDRVRYVGEPLAAVFAIDPYLAEDAAELVTADIEELAPVLSADLAPSPFDAAHSTEADIVRQGYGDVEAAFRAAYAVVELDLKIGRHSGVPIETRGAIARYDASRDLLELHGVAKVPHRNRETLARMLKRPLVGIHLYESHVGGGFGIRGELYPEDVLVCAAALRFERPVKWIEDRYEHLIAANHSRQQRHRIRAAVDADGVVLAIDDEFFHDQGAYIRTHGVRVANMTCAMLPGPYRIPAYRAAGHVRLTNKTPAATYRGPGRYESTFVRERLMDAVAARLGLDSIEVRRRNAIGKQEMPYARPLEALGDNVEYDSGDYVALLDGALDRFGWAKLQAELRGRRDKGEAVGAGLALFVEKSGLGPSDGVRITVDPGGAVEVVTGGASIGQGFETVMAQICADALGVDYRGIRVVHGRTDQIEHGIGAHASRATVMTGSATHVAATKLRAKAMEMAAHLMQTTPDKLDIVDGAAVHRDGAKRASITLAEIARQLSPGSTTRGDREPGLSVVGWFNTQHQVYPYGVHMAVVRVDRETGAVAVERYLAAYDIGRAVNPALVRGQIVGGFAQGLGGALFEQFVYDARGEPLSVTLADYLMPTMRETPTIDVMLVEDYPSPRNPLGIKGAGESGITAVGAVIASAVDAALGVPGAVTELPITPLRVRDILARCRL